MLLHCTYIMCKKDFFYLSHTMYWKKILRHTCLRQFFPLTVYALYYYGNVTRWLSKDQLPHIRKFLHYWLACGYTQIKEKCLVYLPLRHGDLVALATRNNKSCDSARMKEWTSQLICYKIIATTNNNITIATDLVTRVIAPTPKPKK